MIEINYKITQLLLILLVIFLIYRNISNEKKLKSSIEKFSDVQDVDIDAIRNLSEIAKKLQEGGYTVAGDLTVTGKIKTKNIDVGENLQIEGGTKLTKNNNNTISGATTFSNNLQINGTTNANSIEASNVTAINNVTVNNKIQSKHLDITNGSTDEEAWTKFNNNGKNYISGHNWIEAKGHLNYPSNHNSNFNDFMQYKGFKPGYIGFGRFSNSGTQKDVTNVIVHSHYRHPNGEGYFYARDHVNLKTNMSGIDFNKNPKVRDVVGIATPNESTSPGGIYRSHTNPIDNTDIQDNVFYYKK